MKRGKDDEKTMGPMFPRLHVNDTERGGPRAPPRNKMALYEQLTTPHRYSSSSVAVPLNNSNLVPSTSTNQGIGRERNTYFPLYRSTPLAPSYEDRQARNTEAVSSSSQAEQADSRKKQQEEDDFMVPIFCQAVKGASNSKTLNATEGERQKHFNSGYHMMSLSYGDKEANHSSGGDHDPRQHASTRYPDTSLGEKDGRQWRQDISVHGEHAEQHRVSNLEKTDACLHHDLEDSVPALDARYSRDASDQILKSMHQDVPLSLKPNPQVGCGLRDGNEGAVGAQRIVDSRSLEMEIVEQGDDVSETSVVDSASGLDLSPDDVVGILGRKHFWKARTAIVNQQRVFAVQVFELHRLIKVQKLIAASPQLLLEGSGLLEKAASLNRGGGMKQYSAECGVKAVAHHIKQKDDILKASDKLEGTAENAVTKASIPPSQNGGINNGGYQGLPASPMTSPAPPPTPTPTPTPVMNSDPKMNPWGFHQPAATAHQWLVPVMSPSEGLVYKPYPAPGFMGCGGCGPSPTTPPLMNSPYGPPPPPYHQGPGMEMPYGSGGGQGYFFPYGMPPMMMSPAGSGSAVDQTNPCFSYQTGHNHQHPGGSNLQHQSSCNMPNLQKTATATAPPPPPPPPVASKEVEHQGSTASSPPSDTPLPSLAAARDALPLFPTAPTTEEAEAGPPTETLSRVIKVVPHNPGSTRESAARIFRSIQEERRRHDSC